MKTKEKKQKPKQMKFSLTELKAMAFDRARLSERFRDEAAALCQEIAKQEAEAKQNQNNVRQLNSVSTAANITEASKKTIKKAASK